VSRGASSVVRRGTSGAGRSHYDLGYALALRGERAEAERELEAALALDPGLEPARRTLAGLRGQAIP
jgi:Flp pilus assembly protein TadD